jgi:DNA (cytosine-5)-methyltransferase 1
MKLDNLLVDGFAGGGGASTGIEMALGRQVDIAINHDPDAILMHKTNHPDTIHLQESIWDVKPLEVTKGRHVGLLWMSPDCKHFSKAKGGKPKDNKIRSLPWSIIMWARHVRPDVIMAENVEEIQTWGPLNKKGFPIQKKKGQTFKAFVRRLRKLGYKVEWRELVAADYGAPTTRKRWYMIARCDGRPIEWPNPTHSKTDKDGLVKWIPVSTCLDFSDLGQSIFGRKKPLAENTMKRIARGIDKFVFNNPEPFIMQIGQTGFSQDRNRLIHEPLSTIVTKQEHCLVSPILAPYMVTVNHSGANHHYCNSMEEPFRTITQKNGSGIVSPVLIQYHSETTHDHVRGQSVDKPIMTIDASPRYALASCFLSKYYAGESRSTASDVNDPCHTITARQGHALASVFVSKFYKTGTGQAATEPLHTITTSPGHFGEVKILMIEKEEVRSEFREKCNQVASFIIEYYGQGGAHSIEEPLHTVVTKDRFALVTIYGMDYIICDITLRMLTPRELYKAQGFPDDYIIDRDYAGKAYPISKQVARCGNSVVPIMAQKLVEANCSYLKVGDRMPNAIIDDSQPQLKFA